MGGAINCSPISTHFSISVCFLTVQAYKHMHLTIQVYGILIIPVHAYFHPVCKAFKARKQKELTQIHWVMHNLTKAYSKTAQIRIRLGIDILSQLADCIAGLICHFTSCTGSGGEAVSNTCV